MTFIEKMDSLPRIKAGDMLQHKDGGNILKILRVKEDCVDSVLMHPVYSNQHTQFFRFPTDVEKNKMPSVMENIKIL